MGIFKDLNFKNRNGEMVAPDSEKLGGYTLSEVKSQIKPTFVNVGGGTISKATITAANLPVTLHKDSAWTQYKPVAYNFANGIGAVNTNIGLMLDGETLTDISGKTINNTGVTLDASVKKFGSSSLNFNGSASLKTSSTDFDFNSGDFTLEFWFNLKTIGYDFYFVDSITNQHHLGIEYYANKFLFNYTNLQNRVSSIDGGVYNLTPNTWYHFAVCRNSSTSTISMFINGTLMGGTKPIASNILVNPNSKAGGLIIGHAGGTGNLNVNGNIEGLRITKGVARYTTNFTPTEELTTAYGTPVPKKLLINNVEQSIISETLNASGVKVTTFGTVLTNEKDLQVKVEGKIDSLELNFNEGV